MPEDFYDRAGRASHYIDDNGTFYTWGGRPIGFVQGEELYNYAGQHVGRVSQGWIRDGSGNGVAYSANASGGPLPPLRSLPPLKSLPSLAPLRPLPSLPLCRRYRHSHGAD